MRKRRRVRRPGKIPAALSEAIQQDLANQSRLMKGDPTVHGAKGQNKIKRNVPSLPRVRFLEITEDLV